MGGVGRKRRLFASLINLTHKALCYPPGEGGCGGGSLVYARASSSKKGKPWGEHVSVCLRSDIPLGKRTFDIWILYWIISILRQASCTPIRKSSNWYVNKYFSTTNTKDSIRLNYGKLIKCKFWIVGVTFSKLTLLLSYLELEFLQGLGTSLLHPIPSHGILLYNNYHHQAECTP